MLPVLSAITSGSLLETVLGPACALSAMLPVAFAALVQLTCVPMLVLLSLFVTKLLSNPSKKPPFWRSIRSATNALFALSALVSNCHERFSPSPFANAPAVEAVNATTITANLTVAELPTIRSCCPATGNLPDSIRLSRLLSLLQCYVGAVQSTEMLPKTRFSFDSLRACCSQDALAATARNT